MDKLEIEQTETLAQCRRANEVDCGEGKQNFSFKKFKDVESLQKAYSSLESEFTKRSQKLKELEGEKLELINQLEQIRNSRTGEGEFCGKDASEIFLQKYPRAKELLSNLQTENLTQADLSGAYIEYLQDKLSELNEKLGDENFIVSQIEGSAIKDRIIKEFLSGIKNTAPKATLFTDTGETVVVPLLKPKSFEEAGKLSRGLFNKERFD